MAWLLLPQLAALLLGAAAIAHTAAPARLPAFRRRMVQGASWAVALLAATGVIAISAKLLSERRDNIRSTAEARVTRGGREAGVRVAFIEWVGPRLPTAGRYYMAFAGARSGAAYQWAAYRLFPRRVTSNPAAADWVVFYGVRPSKRVGERSVRRLQVFAPKFALAELRP